MVARARRPRPARRVGLTSQLIALGLRVVPRLTETSVAAYAGSLLLRRNGAPATAGVVCGPAAVERLAGGYRRGKLRRALGDRYGRWLASR
jgi:hypothetical protein